MKKQWNSTPEHFKFEVGCWVLLIIIFQLDIQFEKSNYFNLFSHLIFKKWSLVTFFLKMLAEKLYKQVSHSFFLS